MTLNNELLIALTLQQIKEEYLPETLDLFPILIMADQTEINLSSYSIESIKPSAFYGLNRLESFNLTKNKIKNLSKDSFMGMNNLKTLQLSQNEIGIIDK